MQDIVFVIITALISGLLATVVTIIWQKQFDIRKRKLKIFETLMAYRYMITAQESVNALNSVEVVFYNDLAVRKAYEDFIKEAESNKNGNYQLEDKHLKLLEEISKAIGLKDIHWDNIKHYYYPKGLYEKLEEETQLRKMQIESTKIELDIVKQTEKS